MEKNIRLQVDKSDDLPVVAEKVFSADAAEIVLIIPKFSKLAELADSLKFLKKGLAVRKKKLIVESVDDGVLTMAKKAKIAATNPFLNSWEEKEEEIAGLPKAVLASASEDEPENGSNPARVGDETFEKAENEISYDFRNRGKKRRRFQPAIWLFLVLIIAGIWTAYKFLPQAEIKITTKKTDWQFSGQVIVDKNVSVSDASGFKIPGQVFSQTKNIQLSFPASGKDFVKQKAAGKIIIYNAYSSQPQSLVASTRFETSDGKIFRIDQAVIVPGAKIIDGKIEPSAVEASITADKPGKEYNVGPVAKLTIPGFKGSPKFSAFYGEIKSPLAGGFSGETAMATKEDVVLAQKKALESIKNSLELTLASQLPKDFQMPKDASNFKVLNERVDVVADNKNEFSVFIEAELAVIGFRENDLLAVIGGKLKEELGDEYGIKSYELSYSAGESGFDGEKVGLSVDFSAVAEKPIDADELKKRLADKTESDLRAAVFSLPGLERAKVSLWPFWVNKVPDNPEKIKINID